MPTLKKLLFLPIFLFTFITFIYFLSPIFSSYDFVFSFSSSILLQLVIICLILSLSSFLFVMLNTFSDWKFVLAAGILASFSPFLFLESNLSVIFLIGILISFTLTYLNLQTSLKSYLNFSPNAIFGPTIRQLSALLILSICIVYFFSVSKIISQNSFQIPDSLIDFSLKFSGLDVLKQYGIDPSMPQNIAGDLIKKTIKDQFQSLLKPYQSFIPAILAILLFFTLQFLISLINLLIYPLLGLTFYILEKTQIISFTTEQRTVKKFVV